MYYSSVLFATLLLIACRSSPFEPDSQGNFTNAYVTQYRGTTSFEIPEAYELANVVIALSAYNANGYKSDFIKDAYYRDVQRSFAPYLSHPAVTQATARIRAISDNYNLRDNAYRYAFNASGSLEPTGIYGSFYRDDFFGEFQRDLTDFAQKSGFRQFFTAHRAYYDSLKTVQAAQMPVRQMQDWLEARFPDRYDAYKIVASPLTGGNHQTRKFTAPTYREIVLFISSPRMATTELSRGLQSRVVFTEIDHNYVNPVSETFASRIAEAFANRSTWASSRGADTADSYGSAQLVFNEYMTWAVFSLFARQTLSKAAFESVNEQTEQLMLYRGFSKYRDFNQKLLAYYATNPAASVNDWYNALLDWSAIQ